MTTKSVLSVGLLMRFSVMSELRKVAFIKNVDLTVVDHGGVFVKEYGLTMTGDSKNISEITSWLKRIQS